jgi:electron transfer flavoprotein beta subunit
MAAKKKPLETWSVADLDLDGSSVGLAAAYTKVLAAQARPPRGGGEVVTDDEDGGVRLAGFLSTRKFI